jgi:hypothetical protein
MTVSGSSSETSYPIIINQSILKEEITKFRVTYSSVSNYRVSFFILFFFLFFVKSSPLASDPLLPIGAQSLHRALHGLYSDVMNILETQ